MSTPGLAHPWPRAEVSGAQRESLLASYSAYSNSAYSNSAYSKGRGVRTVQARGHPAVALRRSPGSGRSAWACRPQPRVARAGALLHRVRPVGSCRDRPLSTSTNAGFGSMNLNVDRQDMIDHVATAVTVPLLRLPMAAGVGGADHEGGAPGLAGRAPYVLP